MQNTARKESTQEISTYKRTERITKESSESIIQLCGNGNGDAQLLQGKIFPCIC
jgi:hypothetical protein